MDSKKFIQELQKESGLDKALLNKMLSVLGDLIRENGVNLRSVDIPGIGVLEPKKRPEFVYEDKVTGEILLYPPKVVIKFRPDENYIKELNNKL